MRRHRQEDGFALVAAVVLLTVIMGVGLGLLLFSDAQTRASGREQANEAAFNLAEAALNAQVGQLTRHWPKAGEYPTKCTSAEAASTTNVCPYAPSLEQGYGYQKEATCKSVVPGDAWGGITSNGWATYVRDNGSTASPLYNSGTEQGELTYDKDFDGQLWVRAVGVAQCHAVSVVTLVNQQTVALNFPEEAVVGNWFNVTNSGSKTIVDRKGVATENGGISMRCAAPLPPKGCEYYQGGNKEQVSPELTENPTSSSETLSVAERENQKSQAETNGTYFNGPSHCPGSVTELSGFPTWIENCGALNISANGTANSQTSPGFLVLANGTLEVSGTSTFYGLIYAANLDNRTEAVVKLKGNTTVFGAINVDGGGGIEFGSSGNGNGTAANLFYDNSAFKNLKMVVTAAPTRNSFRELPAGQ
jgi:type II secretory pathway pseudopilin PulG